MSIQPAVLLRVDVPDDVAAWASEIACINADLQDENLLAAGPFGPSGAMNLYGGVAPVATHVDVSIDELTRPDGSIATRHATWGLVLTDLDGFLTWAGDSAPLVRGSVYAVDPAANHGVATRSGIRTHLAFMATWGLDPASVFDGPAAFARQALEAVFEAMRECPDPLRYMERAAGLEEGELS